ncbi:MAG: dTMP kinase [Acidobacteria bacterium]|nr:dTMP kinase [Acidobacteriota bacterium]
MFVVFEGIDACGKSTQARRVAHDRGARFVFEPGDTVLGAQLRGWLLDASTPMSPVTESLMMLADRSHHVATVIEPTLARGTPVVADRFYASTLAYQGYGRGVDMADLQAATDLAIGGCRPAMTVLIDIDVDTANERRARSAEDRFESADAAFHDRVREGYLEMAARDHARWFVVDGRATIDEVAAVIDERLGALDW